MKKRFARSGCRVVSAAAIIDKTATNQQQTDEMVCVALLMNQTFLLELSHITAMTNRSDDVNSSVFMSIRSRDTNI